jgi:catechol 2,3-dioxygenase
VGESGTRVGASDHLVSEALYLRDPDGLGIEVYVDRPRETWLRHGRELVMATNPLDMAAVAHAAGRTRWSGMPAGTTIGHVHLHVGDLERSAAFYHAGLGLDRVVWSYPGALFLSAGGYHHHLGTNTWAGPGASGPAQDEAQLLDWEFVLPGEGDVSAAVRSLEAFGYAAGRAERGWVVPDPWGTRVRLIAAAS